MSSPPEHRNSQELPVFWERVVKVSQVVVTASSIVAGGYLLFLAVDVMAEVQEANDYDMGEEYFMMLLLFSLGVLTYAQFCLEFSTLVGEELTSAIRDFLDEE